MRQDGMKNMGKSPSKIIFCEKAENIATQKGSAAEAY
jgi:hypothetical protein